MSHPMAVLLALLNTACFGLNAAMLYRNLTDTQSALGVGVSSAAMLASGTVAVIFWFKAFCDE